MNVQDLQGRVSNLFESTWLSINIEFGRVHEWVGNGPITITHKDWYAVKLKKKTKWLFLPGIYLKAISVAQRQNNLT